MHETTYTTRPRPVHAAQWNPTKSRKAGLFLGLLMEQGIRYTHLDDGALELTGLDLIVREGDWLVVYTDDTSPELVSDQDFHKRFAPVASGSERRSGGAVNAVLGKVEGVLVQSGGDVHLPQGWRP